MGSKWLSEIGRTGKRNWYALGSENAFQGFRPLVQAEQQFKWIPGCANLVKMPVHGIRGRYLHGFAHRETNSKPS